MKKMTLTKTQSAIAIALLASGFAAYAASPSQPDLPSKGQNTSHSDTSPAGTTAYDRVGVASTRHNLTQSYLAGTANQYTMDRYRNNYGEVCVYCHTPHGSSTVIDAPLWNRSTSAATYTPYNSMSLVDNPNADKRGWKPGANSLTCLSCHDGTVAIDSIINMPGSGKYQESQMKVDRNNSQELASSITFLNGWTNPSGSRSSHRTLGDPAGAANSVSLANPGCTICHSNNDFDWEATDFRAFVIGTDLRDDHPVGVRFPLGPAEEVGFFQPGSEIKNLKYFDEGANGLSKEDIRIFSYDGNTKYQVECSSCHDPHGVPSAAPGSKFIPSFLRKKNSGSAVCVTCHVK